VWWVPPHQAWACPKPVSFALFYLGEEGEKGLENGQSMLGQLFLPSSWVNQFVVELTGFPGILRDLQ